MAVQGVNAVYGLPVKVVYTCSLTPFSVSLGSQTRQTWQDLSLCSLG